VRKIPQGFLDGGAGLMPGFGVPGPDGVPVDLLQVLQSIETPVVASVAAAQALTSGSWGGFIVIGSDLYMWSATSTANCPLNYITIRPTAIGSGAAGRFVRVGRTGVLALPFTSTTANNAVLYTVPTGYRLNLSTGRPFYDISVSFTGGSTPAIGNSSSNAAYNTAGDLQGGASGDLTAALTAGIRGGTIGARLASQGLVVLVGGDTIIHNRIASNFAAGTGVINFPFTLV
jgi:hypothetical protein